MIRFESDLCHIDQTKAVVRVTAFKDGIRLGSCLGEAIDTEAAETKATNKLLVRFGGKAKTSNNLVKERIEPVDTNKNNLHYNDNSLDKDREHNLSSAPNELNNSDNKNTENNRSIPEDWSEMITKVELELKKIGWSKDEEKNYLQRNYGVNGKDRITKFDEMNQFYRDLLSINSGIETNSEILVSNRNLIIEESNEIIAKLNWDKNKARDFLKEHFNVLSRTELGIKELQHFNALLGKQITNKKVDIISK
tara:strand:- start:1664 stop:2416 length:753 start_codon:yes stop_codon:yes gene_type:complete